MSTDSRPLVVHVVHALGVGGLENGLVNLLNGELGRRYRHAIICLTAAGAFRERLSDEVAVYEMHRRSGQDPRMLWRVWRLLRRLRPVLVHTRNLGTLECQWAAWLAGVPCRLHSEHGWAADDPRGQNPRHRWLRRLCAPVVQRYLAMSKDIARWLEHDISLPARRISQIYNGVDVAKFQPVAPARADTAAPWPDGSFVVGCVARLDAVKDPVGLAEAVARLQQRLPPGSPPVWLAWIGDGPAREELASALSRLGLSCRAWLPGARTDVADWLPRFSVFALASLNEGISNTLLEAMAAGLPVVARHVGGNPEVVEDGAVGRLVADDHPDALAAALSAYAESQELRVRHGAAGRRRVEERFSLDAMQSGYCRLYAELLAGRR